MSEWVSESDISSRLGHKILIAGLSEAGKTAVKRIFFLKQKTQDVDSLSATINYERMSVTVKDTPITIVDLGGQKVFLKRFLSAFSPFVFSNVKIFIFLIDVSNKTTRNNALQYFTACLEKLQEYSPDATVYLFLHKNDLVRSSPNYESIHEQMKESFQLESNQPLRFFRTTIYKPETIINAFGRIFELTLPNIAMSDFVDGKEIGEIEEFHKDSMTLREPKVHVETKTTKIKIAQPKMAGDPAVLARLQSLMKEATTGPQKARVPPSYLGEAVTEETVSEKVLTPIETKEVEAQVDETATEITTPIEETTVSTPSINEITTPTETELPLAEIKTTPVTPSEEEVMEQPAEYAAFMDPDEVVNQILYLVDFCRIDPEDATEVVKSGYGELFKIAASSGIPVPLLTDVFLKYIPFVRTSEGEERMKHLTGERLLDVFSAHLKNELTEKHFIQCLVYAVEKPSVAIREIINQYILPEIEKEKVLAKEKVKVKKKPEPTKISVPVEVESTDGIISLPDAQGVAFKATLLDDSRNANLTFYLRGSAGQIENIGSSTVSANINAEEILYLLAYEMNLFTLGYFEDGAASMAFSARIIHQTIQKMKEQKLTSSVEVPTKKKRVEEGYLSDTIDYIIPMTLDPDFADGDYLILPDTEYLAFSVERSAKKGLTISFTQRGYPVGSVNVIKNINQKQLSGLLREAMQLPIESPGAVDFAARMIKVIIDELVVTKKTKLPRKPALEKKEEGEEVEEETSERLMHYLSLLEKE